MLINNLDCQASTSYHASHGLRRDPLQEEVDSNDARSHCPLTEAILERGPEDHGQHVILESAVAFSQRYNQ